MLHELHTALFSSLIETGPCDECRIKDCAQGYWIDHMGKFRATYSDTPGRQVSWPDCPSKYATLRRQGAGIMPLDQVLRWNTDQDIHKSDLLGWGAARVYREYLATREIPAILRENKRAQAAADKAKQR